jgi:hypothetical protein
MAILCAPCTGEFDSDQTPSKYAAQGVTAFADLIATERAQLWPQRGLRN